MCMTDRELRERERELTASMLEVRRRLERERSRWRMLCE